MAEYKEEWSVVELAEFYNESESWIEEEDRLLKWAESPIFEKQPLSKIAMNCIYIDLSNAVTGILKTAIELEPCGLLSKIYRSDFFDKIHIAKTPKSIFRNSTEYKSWMEKSYLFDDSVLFSIPIEHEQIEHFDRKIPFEPLHFSKDVLKLPAASIVFHDLYEIVVILREAKPTTTLKSSVASSSSSERNSGKTKKVRISDDLPKEYVFSNMVPVSGKRRTRKTHHTSRP